MLLFAFIPSIFSFSTFILLTFIYVIFIIILIIIHIRFVVISAFYWKPILLSTIFERLSRSITVHANPCFHEITRIICPPVFVHLKREPNDSLFWTQSTSPLAHPLFTFSIQQSIQP
jgi:hypothetical protein